MSSALPAISDCFGAVAAPDRARGQSHGEHVHGTALRVYDAGIDARQTQWTDPVTQTLLSMICRGELWIDSGATLNSSPAASDAVGQ
jgi:hypothetical protein